eukprot:scaffold61270_cov43-Attheya_sp.AAC.1
MGKRRHTKAESRSRRTQNRRRRLAQERECATPHGGRTAPLYMPSRWEEERQRERAASHGGRTAPLHMPS